MVYLVYALRSNCNKDAYMHEQTTKGVGKMNITVSEVGLELPSSLKSGFLWALHLQSTYYDNETVF